MLLLAQPVVGWDFSTDNIELNNLFIIYNVAFLAYEFGYLNKSFSRYIFIFTHFDESISLFFIVDLDRHK